MFSFCILSLTSIGSPFMEGEKCVQADFFQSAYTLIHPCPQQILKDSWSENSSHYNFFSSVAILLLSEWVRYQFSIILWYRERIWVKASFTKIEAKESAYSIPPTGSEMRTYNWPVTLSSRVSSTPNHFSSFVLSEGPKILPPIF